LSRRLAQRYHYPAVDVLGSVSRLSNKVTDVETQEAAGYVRRLLAVYRESEDLINVGAYARGSNDEIDEAIDKMPAINRFLRQAVDERAELGDTRRELKALAGIEDHDADAPTEEAAPADDRVPAVTAGATQEDDGA
jgi:flagellum-specific ATP synthase